MRADRPPRRPLGPSPRAGGPPRLEREPCQALVASTCGRHGVRPARAVRLYCTLVRDPPFAVRWSGPGSSAAAIAISKSGAWTHGTLHRPRAVRAGVAAHGCECDERRARHAREDRFTPARGDGFRVRRGARPNRLVRPSRSCARPARPPRPWRAGPQPRRRCGPSSPRISSVCSPCPGAIERGAQGVPPKSTGEAGERRRRRTVRHLAEGARGGDLRVGDHLVGPIAPAPTRGPSSASKIAPHSSGVFVAKIASSSAIRLSAFCARDIGSA